MYNFSGSKLGAPGYGMIETEMVRELYKAVDPADDPGDPSEMKSSWARRLILWLSRLGQRQPSGRSTFKDPTCIQAAPASPRH